MLSATVVRSSLHSSGAMRPLRSAIPRATKANSPVCEGRKGEGGMERNGKERKEEGGGKEGEREGMGREGRGREGREGKRKGEGMKGKVRR